MDTTDPYRPRTTRSFPPQYLAPRGRLTGMFLALWVVAGVLLIVLVVLLVRR